MALRPWLAAIADRAGKMTRDQQRLLKQFQEDCGREVTKVKKTPGKSSVIFGGTIKFRKRNMILDCFFNELMFQPPNLYLFFL
jgi:hypothetical protein